MDVANIASLFAATLNPTSREDAEKKLGSMKKIITFGPLILQHVRNPAGELPSRQAAAIYLKNFIVHNWADPDEAEIKRALDKGEKQPPFSIHEQDRTILRDAVLEAIIECPEVLRTQMAVALQNICKIDFPERWTNVVQRVNGCLRSPQHETWYGALLALYHLVKAFEYRTSEDRVPLDEALKFLYPLLQQRLLELLPDSSEMAWSLIKLILKIFSTHVQLDFPKDILTIETTEPWIDTLLQVFRAPIPAKVDELDDDEKADTIWWKCKKWCLRIFSRVFERYGTPGDVRKEYNAFAKVFVVKLAKQILGDVFGLLKEKTLGRFVSNRCTELSLNYVRQALKVPSCWKLIKPHAQEMLKFVIFPLMCFSENDTEMWQDDPVEWILAKTDFQNEHQSAEAAAGYLLHTLCRKHPNLLPDIINFVINTLKSETSTPRDKDGALHFFGIMGKTLMNRKPYKDSVENMLVTHGIPEMQNAHPMIRYRALWLFRQFAVLEYRHKDNLYLGLESARRLLMEDNQLPVRVEAGICLNEVLDNQKAAEDFLRPHAVSVLQVVLELVKLTNYEDLAEALQTFVVEYPEEMAPVAIELATHLLGTFQEIVNKSTAANSDEERTSVMTAMSVLQTMELLNDVTVEKPELNAQLAPIVVQVIQIILSHNLAEFYEEMFGLLTSLTSKRIAPALWEGFNICSKILFHDDSGLDYFSDMLMVLYNYATVDKDGFLADPERLKALCHMCEAVIFGDDVGEDAQCHAAKLLEVILLTYKGRIDPYVAPMMQVVFRKLFSAQTLMSEVKTQLLLVVVAALYYDPGSVLSILQQARTAEGEELMVKFLTTLLAEIDCMFGIHDKKLTVLGLTLFMQLPANLRNPAVVGMAPQFLPASLQLFQGLKRMYLHEESDSEDEWTDEENEDDVVHTDDEDVKPEPSHMEHEGGENDDDDDDDEDWVSEDYGSETLKNLTTPLDDTALDEFAIFKQTIMQVQQHDPEWWGLLANKTSETDKNLLLEMLKFADDRHAKPPEEPHVKKQ